MKKILMTVAALLLLSAGVATAEAGPYGYGYYSHQTATGGPSGEPNQGG